MSSEVDIKLERISVRLNENLNASESSASKFKWERAILYHEARSLFRSDKLFGQWIKSYSTGAGRVETGNSISKLVMCVNFLTEEQFLTLGCTKAVELMNKTLWKTHTSKMKELVDCGHKYSQRELREMVKVVKGSDPDLVAALPEPRAVDPAIRVAELRTELDILEHVYLYSSSDFFHPDKRFRDIQINELSKGNKYCLLFFGLEESFSEKDLSSRFKSLSLKYHTDRPGGSDELMMLVNKLNEHLKNYLFIRNTKH